MQTVNDKWVEIIPPNILLSLLKYKQDCKNQLLTLYAAISQILVFFTSWYSAGKILFNIAIQAISSRN